MGILQLYLIVIISLYNFNKTNKMPSFLHMEGYRYQYSQDILILNMLHILINKAGIMISWIQLIWNGILSFKSGTIVIYMVPNSILFSVCVRHVLSSF